MSGFEKTQVCRAVPYDNAASGMQARNAQDAIDELRFSSLPPFTWARKGNTPTNTWLEYNGIPSNITGCFVYLYDARIETIFVGNQTGSPYTLALYHHAGDGVNMTLIGSVVVTGAGGSFNPGWSIPHGKWLASRITSGSVANIAAGATVSGRLTP